MEQLSSEMCYISIQCRCIEDVVHVNWSIMYAANFTQKKLGQQSYHLNRLIVLKNYKIFSSVFLYETSTEKPGKVKEINFRHWK